MLLEHGKMIEIGDPENVGNRYLELNFSAEARAAEKTGEPQRPPVFKTPTAEDEGRRYGDGRAEILDAWFEDELALASETIKTAYPAGVACYVRFNRDVENPVISLEVHNSRRDLILSQTTREKQPDTGSFKAGDEVRFRFTFGNLLGPDRYFATIALEQPSGHWLDRRERFISAVVASTHPTGALVELPYDIEIVTMSPARSARP
jgi:hypothetical protein